MKTIAGLENQVKELQNKIDEMIEKKKYNGWSNYETWLVKLWLDNEQKTADLQKEWLNRAKNTPKVDVWTIEETVKFTLADILKDEVNGMIPMRISNHADLWCDLINAGLSEVDWQEIADNIISDY